MCVRAHASAKVCVFKYKSRERMQCAAPVYVCKYKSGKDASVWRQCVRQCSVCGSAVCCGCIVNAHCP